MKDWIVDVWENWGMCIIVSVAALVVVGFVCLAVAVTNQQDHDAYNVYLRETGKTNLTFNEFVTMKNEHLLKRIGE